MLGLGYVLQITKGIQTLTCGLDQGMEDTDLWVRAGSLLDKTRIL